MKDYPGDGSWAELKWRNCQLQTRRGRNRRRDHRNPSARQSYSSQYSLQSTVLSRHSMTAQRSWLWLVRNRARRSPAAIVFIFIFYFFLAGSVQ